MFTSVRLPDKVGHRRTIRWLRRHGPDPVGKIVEVEQCVEDEHDRAFWHDYNEVEAIPEWLRPRVCWACGRGERAPHHITSSLTVGLRRMPPRWWISHNPDFSALSVARR